MLCVIVKRVEDYFRLVGSGWASYRKWDLKRTPGDGRNWMRSGKQLIPGGGNTSSRDRKLEFSLAVRIRK